MARPTSILAPRISPIRLIGLTDSEGSLPEAHESYDGVRYASTDLSELDLAGSSFSECELLDVTAHDTDLRAASFVDTRIDRLNAPVFKAARSRFRNVEFDDSRLGSAELYDASWQSVHVSNSKLGFVNLREADLRDVLFTNCVIDELDLGGAKVSRVSFVDCTVRNLEVTQAKLQHVDLRDLEMRGITGFEGLRGATMSDFQVTELAPIFARHFGINIEG